MLVEHEHFLVRLTIDPVGVALSCKAAPAEVGSHCEPWIDATGREYGYCFQDGDWYRVHIFDVGHFAFMPQSDMVWGAPAPGVAPGDFYHAFCRELVPYILQLHSWEALHASGLVIAGECVALCGDSQMGKSTLAHAWRRRGGSVYADDAIPFRVEGEAAHVRSIPFQIRLRPASLRYFGLMDTEVAEPDSGGQPPPALRGTLRAIYLLDRRRDEERGAVVLEPAAAEAALPALLRQAYCLTLRDRGRSREIVENYIALVNTVPICRLSYPTGLMHVETILDRLTEHVSGRLA